MRIGFFNDKYVLGGAEKVTGDIIAGMKRLDSDLEFFIITINYKEYGLSGGAKIVTLPAATNTKKPQGAIALINTVKKLRLDTLIVLIDPAPGLMMTLHENLPDVRLIVQYHSQPMWQVAHKTFGNRIKRWRERIFHSYSRRYLNRLREECHYADAVVTLCNAYAEQIKELLDNSKDREKVHVMHNPLTLTAKPATIREKAVIYVGRLSLPDKRVDRLMRIWKPIEAKHPDWRFKIIGSGEAEPLMRQQIKELNLKNVDFCGYCSDPSEYYRTASILCLTSDYEGWGLVLVEGLTCGITPIAMNCSPGVEEILSEGRGVLVNPGDEQMFTTELDRLISTGRNTTDPMPFLNQLSTEAICAKWIKLLSCS